MDFRSKSPLSHTAWPLTKSYHIENSNLSRSLWRTMDHSQWGPLFTICQFKPPPQSIFHLFLNTTLAAQPYTYPKFMDPWISFWLLLDTPIRAKSPSSQTPFFIQLKISKLLLNRSQKITKKEKEQTNRSKLRQFASQNKSPLINFI